MKFYINNHFNLVINSKNILSNIKNSWGLGIGDWGLGIGDWAQSPIPKPQSPKIYAYLFLFF
jgi:hypothetical protein